MDVVINAELDNIPPGVQPLEGQSNFYLNLLTCLGLDSQRAALADLLRRYHQLEGEWLIASPIHWEAGHNDAMLVASGNSLGLTEEESRLWFAAAADFLKADGFEPVFHDAHHWLLKIDGKTPISSKSVHSLLHQSIMPELATLDDSLFWQRLITEFQMFLSAHPLNNQREGKLAVNGLWFWGAGAFEFSRRGAIATDDERLLNQTFFPGAIQSLNFSEPFQKEQLLIINDLKSIDLSELQDKTKTMSVRWYWNNVAYQSQSSHWWSRLWRK